MLLACAGLACGERGQDEGRGASLASAPSAAQTVPQKHVPCALAPAGSPAEIFTFRDRNVSGPVPTVVFPGKRGEGEGTVFVTVLANAGFSSLPSDQEVFQIRVGQAFPGGLASTGPTFAGEFAIGRAELVASGGRALLAWSRETVDMARPMVRSMDAVTGALSEGVPLAEKGGAILSLGAGPAGEAAVVWRDHNAPGVGPAEPHLRLVDAMGIPTTDVLALAGPEDYPGRSPDLTFAGKNYLVATAYETCGGGDPLCEPHGITISRVEKAARRLSLVETARLGPSPEGARVRAWLASTQGATYLVYAEATTSRTERLFAMSLSEGGIPTSSPVLLVPEIPREVKVSVGAGPHGLLLAYAQADGKGDSHAVGASRVQVVHLAQEDSSPTKYEFLSTYVNQVTPPQAVMLEHPRSVLLFWAGRSTASDKLDVGYVARLDCE